MRAIFTIASLLLSGLVTADFAVASERSAVSHHGALSVQGNRVTDQQGETLSLAGPSLFWGNRGWTERAEYPPDAYYNAAVVSYMRREWNAAIIRISMGAESRGGYIEDPEGRWARIAAVAEAALDEGMYFIVDWHSHRAEQNTEAAVAFFQRVARTWGETPNLIYEIYNEPLNTTDWATVIKPYSEQVVGAIRAIDADNLIVVGTQTWSQDVDKAADDPLTGFSNIAYALHFYAGTHKQALRDKADYALDHGIALMVTEWGTVDATGDGRVDLESSRKWVEWMRQKQLTHLNWSLHSKREAASILVTGSPPEADWTDANFTPSGLFVRDVIRSWQNVDHGGAD